MNGTSAPIRVGPIGVGNRARHGHLRVLALLPRHERVTIHSRRRSVRSGAARHDRLGPLLRSAAGEDVAREHGIRHVVSSADALANHPEVDLVIVPTTAPQHEERIRAAIAAGKHIDREWPLTTSTATSVELLRLADAQGIRTMLACSGASHRTTAGGLTRSATTGSAACARSACKRA